MSDKYTDNGIRMSTSPRMHEDYGRQEKITPSSDRNFGGVFAVVFALLAALSWWAGGHNWPWWLGLAVVTLVIAAVAPGWLAPLNALWTKFGLLLAKFISPVALGLIFAITIVPIGLYMRLTRRDLLRLRLDPHAPSYWIQRHPPGPAPETMSDQF